jgi:hypothetical protein
MSNDNPIHNGPYQAPPRKPGKAVYVGSMQPFAGMAHQGQMHATPAARAIKHDKSLAGRARKYFKGK